MLVPLRRPLARVAGIGWQRLITNVWGDLTDVRGNLTDVRGYLSDCAITDEDRAAGVDINDLIDSAEPLAKEKGA